MIRYLVVLLLFVVTVFSKGYPQQFEKLSAPLYDSKEPITKLSSNFKNIKEHANSYLLELESVKSFGYGVDKNKNDSEIKEYLFKLRKLQKKHDYILYQIHESINNSINENNYKQFVKLTKYELNGLLKSRALLDKSLIFYKKNKLKKHIVFLDKKIHDKKILQITEESFNVVTTSTYNSSNSTTKKKSVSIDVIKYDNFYSVSLQNNNAYSITMKIKGTYKNLSYDESVKNEFSLKAGEKKEYIHLYKHIGASSYSYSYKYRWIMGSLDAKHSDYVYRLPYAKGDNHIVSQGYNGKFTHKGHSQYAIDFAMPVGTKIYSAREGIVIKIKEDSNKGGASREFSKYGNFITIEHSDNTMGTYYHLKKGGVVVKVGQRVNKGDFIGYSGNTGYSSGPHLHFAIFKALSAARTKTIPIKFLSEKGVIDRPIRGVSYIAK